MAFTIKTRGARGPMVAEYLCPLHGRFEATVRRDEKGDPPATQPCPEFEDVLGAAVRCPHDDAEHVISAARLKFPFFKGPTFRGNGRPEERPSEAFQDTEPLADGMPMYEWEAKRRKFWEDWREAKIRKDLG